MGHRTRKFVFAGVAALCVGGVTLTTAGSTSASTAASVAGLVGRAALTPSAGQAYGGALGRALTADPLHAADTARAAAAPFLDAAGRVGPALRGQATVIGVRPPAPSAPLTTDLVDAVARLDEVAGVALAPTARASLAASSARLPQPVAAAIADVVSATAAGASMRAAAFARLTPADLSLLAAAPAVSAKPIATAGHTVSLVAGATDAGLAPLAARQAVLAKIDMASLLQGSLLTADAVDRARAALVAAQRAGLFGTEAASTTPLLRESTPYGDIVVKGTGNDVNNEDAFVLVDLGGHNAYQGPAAAAHGTLLPFVTKVASGSLPSAADVVALTQTRIVLDLGSHNVFTGTDEVQGFGSQGGLGILVSEGGTDTYTANDGAQGYGLLGGIGILDDLGGHNVWTADRNAQAFSDNGGIGMLLSALGNDTFNASVFAQGAGFSGGVGGTLVDGGGHDLYSCTGTIDTANVILPVSAPRPSTLCHGVGFGGEGMLVDGGGNNTYRIATSFQGMGLEGVGVIVDKGGNDLFDAGEWSNGFGVLGSGVVAVGPGASTFLSNERVGPWADVYVGSNGEGYEGGLGVLADQGGNDTFAAAVYKGYWLPQYACSEACSFDAGVGILDEGKGTSSFTSEVGQGAGLGGFAVLLDGGGSATFNLNVPGEVRGQGFASDTPWPAPLPVFNCGVGYLIDAGGSNTYSNPVTTRGHRGNNQWWEDNDYGRGADGQSGISGYATQQLANDLHSYLQRYACESVTPPPAPIP